jgi:hypothetical protein
MPEDDQRLWADMLEGSAQGADPFSVVDRLVGAILERERFAEALRLWRNADLAERQARFDRAATRQRAIVQQFLERLAIRRLTRPGFTLSIGPGRPHVVPSASPEQLPARFQRVSVEADRQALAEALRAGEADVPATWSNPEPVLTIRVR